MSLPARTIRRAIRELLEGQIGSTRTLLQGVFKYGTFDGQPLGAEQAHALNRDYGLHWFNVRFGRIRSNAASPSSAMGNYLVANLATTIEITTHLPSTVEEDERDDVIAEVASDLFLAAEAIGYPENLAADSEGTSTRIVDGCSLGEPEYEAVPNWEIQLMRSRIEFVLPLQLTREV